MLPHLKILADYSVIGFLIESECSLPTFLHNATQPEALHEKDRKRRGVPPRKDNAGLRKMAKATVLPESRVYTSIYIYSIYLFHHSNVHRMFNCIYFSNVYRLFMFLKL